MDRYKIELFQVVKGKKKVFTGFFCSGETDMNGFGSLPNHENLILLNFFCMK